MNNDIEEEVKSTFIEMNRLNVNAEDPSQEPTLEAVNNMAAQQTID